MSKEAQVRIKRISDGEEATPKADDSGTLTRFGLSYNFKDVTTTGSATLNLNKADNETTFMAGSTSYFHDLVYVSGANSSTNAVRLVFRDGNAGADLFDLSIPANSTEELTFRVPIPQSEKGMLWAVDFKANANIADPNDVTNTTVTVFAEAINRS